MWSSPYVVQIIWQFTMVSIVGIMMSYFGKLWKIYTFDIILDRISQLPFLNLKLFGIRRKCQVKIQYFYTHQMTGYITSMQK